MKRQGGFTLIELVVVIVILGILAVTAAPRFLNLQSDARESALQGLKGAMDGAAGIVYGKAAIEGKEAKDGQTLESGVKTDFGYPSADADGLVKAVTGLNDDWAWATQTTSGSISTIVATFVTGNLVAGENKDASKITDTECYVTYTEAESAELGKEAKTKVTDTKC
ncbi:type II secretion system protein [Vibrio parahaemolyticus]|uniref:type II secretion system protein n=1 Tax=Vibrio parahaemolyticus TaxID=670 RepID=UPI0003485ECB|nr:prepilin-type N-terminal cleavage/methylation domain-containing protein [Vibrio parahaemolyticus]MDF4582697.1 type II secretion system protein [Vibrio parahaemolyticus]MDF4672013.1 type II secretion system protein [Vibrio parahaemolyticus]RXQ01618.1 type II secretion system protein [Vibrio parahaemolyticus]HAV1415340.1 type II secretion system protein [Vibrio parahaemolyticus]HAV2008141.1 type II secretion system protein [Vibrio parahaemolyticus]